MQKCIIQIKKYKDYLDTMQDLLENKEKFIKAEKEIAKKLGM